MIENLNDLATKVHALAQEKGMWAGERDVDEARMLCVSELAEALEAHRNDEDPVWWKYVTDRGPTFVDHATTIAELVGRHPEAYKPEGVAIELADCIIRCLDLLSTLDVDLDAAIGAYRMDRLPDNFGAALLAVTLALCLHNGGGLLTAINGCTVLIERFGEDPAELVNLKLAYNRTRPALHGRMY